MLAIRIGLVSRSRAVDLPSLTRVANALNHQVNRDVAPIWRLSATVIAVPDATRLDPGIWPIFIVDQLDGGASGLHFTDHNQPYAVVVAGDTWSLAASHEAIEMLVDPSGNRLVTAPAIKIFNNEIRDSAGKFEYLVEACGPSIDPGCAYLVDDVLVADFYTPSYFDPNASVGTRYSFSGQLTRPRQVLPGGTLAWFDPSTSKVQQVRLVGVPEIVDLAWIKPSGGSLTDGLALRTLVDQRAKPTIALGALKAYDKAVLRRGERVTFLSVAGPARAGMFTAALQPAARQAARVAEGGGEGASAAADAKPASRKLASHESVRAVIFSNATHLTLPGILSVRPGLHLGADGFTNERVVVVKARPDAVAGLRQQIPADFDGIGVEIRAADALERLRVRNGTTYLQVAAARHELRAPVFGDALYLDGSGGTVDDATVAAAALVANPAKRRINYTAPADASLDAVTGTMTLVLHASPDAGWRELSKFLSTNPGNLVVGMYDFTSGHVLKALTAAVPAGRKLTLTLDRPAPSPNSDQSDDEARFDLAAQLGRRFEGAWALTNADPKAAAWVFPNAYHLKVAVRDDDRFWLSSGNWNNGNQPLLDVSDMAAALKIAARSDRDWHVIVTNKTLADTFRAFLMHDHRVAASECGPQPAGGATSPGAPTLPVVPTDSFAGSRAPRQLFPPKTLTINARVQPLLTPDNYQPVVNALIESAKSTFYLQTQYIHPSGKVGDEDFDALIAAVRQLVKAGVDVRLILSAYQTDDWMEKLVMRGIPSSVLRRQAGVHNKGLIVDRRAVLVGSQDWSADGALRNRDAGLIIHDETAAAYFEEIFLHDWEHMALPVTG